jgi:indole-3-glycerol phosphate synthase
MDALIEVHDRAELERALRLPTPLIGINNRNLKTFAVSLNVTLGLRAHVPNDRILVTESGISKPTDVDLMLANGINTFLVGESFMREEHPDHAFKTLFGQPKISA